MRFMVSAVDVLVPWTFLNIQGKRTNVARGWEQRGGPGLGLWGGHTHDKQIR